MHPLSDRAKTILSRMEHDRIYEPAELRAFVPDTSLETLREIMHELWLTRQVERRGVAGWVCERSSCGPEGVRGRRGEPHADGRCGRNARPAQTKAVRPEDLFDHESFSEFFK